MNASIAKRCVVACCGPFLAQCSAPPVLDEARASLLDAVIMEVNQDNLMQSVQALVDAHDNEDRSGCFPATHRLCRLTRKDAGDVLLSRFQALGLPVESHGEGTGEFATTTIVAEKRGSKRPDEIVFVGAHFDAFDSGADDNSSGVAAVLEIARVLRDRDFPRTIRFVGFDLEEFGLVGSTRYATTMAAQDNIVGAIIFDCIGYRSEKPNSQQSIPGFPAPSQGDFIAVISNAPSAHLSDDAWLIQQRWNVVKVLGIDSAGSSDSLAGSNLMRSDHVPFWLQDKPALFLTDTANFRNPHYHQPTDTISTLDPEFLKGVTQLSAALIAYWAGG